MSARSQRRVAAKLLDRARAETAFDETSVETMADLVSANARNAVVGRKDARCALNAAAWALLLAETLAAREAEVMTPQRDDEEPRW